MTLEISVTRDIATCRELRHIVFIEEQGFPEAVEVDDRDDEAIHPLARLNGKPIGSARLLILAETGKIGRICVLPAQRGTDLGSALVHRAVAEFRTLPGIARVKLSAQVHASGFYERLGFAQVGEQYLEAGIPHRDMALTL